MATTPAAGNLDERIDAILRDSLDIRVDEGQAYIHDTDQAIERVKQAFKDAGWSDPETTELFQEDLSRAL